MTMHSRPRGRSGLPRRSTRPVLGVDRLTAVGPSLFDLRLSQEVTQADAASAMESTHATTVGAWENNRHVISLRKLVELLAVYDYQLVFMHKKSFEELVRPRDRDE